jgi:hypothetical protein
VKADHQSTIRASTLRGPITSPSQPIGTSNAEYAIVNTLNTQAIWTKLRPSSSRITAPADEIATRSR